MCADALQGLWDMGAALDLWADTSRISLFLGWASWQTRGVAIAVLTTLLSYNHISDHERNCQSKEMKKQNQNETSINFTLYSAQQTKKGVKLL